MRFVWKSQNNFDKCKAFIANDYLYVRRDHDGKWSCFSKYCGWQESADEMALTHFKHASKVFFEGDILEWVF